MLDLNSLALLGFIAAPFLLVGGVVLLIRALNRSGGIGRGEPGGEPYVYDSGWQPAEPPPIDLPDTYPEEPSQ